MQNLLLQNGAQPQKQPKYVPLFVERFFTGLYTQRSALRDPSDLATAHFYGGRQDVLWQGNNIELTNRLTLQRRPGLTPFSMAMYSTPPDRAFSFELTNGTIQVIIDTETAVYIDNQDGTKTLLFTKSAGAGQTYFVAVAGVLYMGDGVDTRIYTPGNPNGTVWNFGGPAPIKGPTIIITESGASAAVWQPDTWYSTMGVIIDSNGNAQQLVSVNADGTNPGSSYGETGNGQPVWNQGTGGTTNDGSIVWQNFGQIIEWAANLTVQPGQPIYDPTTNCIFIQSRGPGSFITGPSKPMFIPLPAVGANAGVRTFESSPGSAKWMCLGQVGMPTLSMIGLWLPSTAFNELYNPGTGTVPGDGYPGYFNSALVEPTLTMPPSAQPQYLQACNPPGGTSAASYTQPHWATVAGETTQDNQLSWLCLGSATWTAATGYTQWVTKGSVFSAIEDSNGNIQVCIQSGVSGATEPPAGGGEGLGWGTAYGGTTQDGSVQWVCVGPATNWPGANIQCYLSAAGFQPPQSNSPFGGASVIGSGFVQFTIQTGISGGTVPAWSTTIGSNTTDNTVVWQCESMYSANSLAWTVGYSYAYSYGSRLTTDSYNTTPPPGLANPLGQPTGSETGAITTASPATVILGPNAGAVNTVEGIGPTDTQFDTIYIWRSADGGGSDNMFLLTEINAPKPINGVGQPWSFQDYLPDVANAKYPGLNDLIPAPIDDQNDPPPSNFLPMVYNFQRIWGASGSTVFFSGGPDVITGNANFAFNPLDDFPYEATVIRIVKTSAGLIIFLTDSIEQIAGGPVTSSFFSVTIGPGIGLFSYNALDQYAGEIYFFTADSQMRVMNPNLNISTAGFPLGDKFANFDPSKVYVAVHQSGVDNCVFVTDGSTGWYRCNPHQVPGGTNGPEPIWSPFATITGGCKMVQSIEVSPGVKKLLVGSTADNQVILERNLNVFTDNGTTYDANFVMGSIMLAHPGQIAALKFIEADFSGVAFQPQISYLLDEINTPQGTGVFVPFTLAPQFDPPSLYGTTLAPVSYSPNRYYFAGTGSLARCRHLQIKVDFGSTSVGDEIYTFTIYGRLLVEL